MIEISTNGIDKNELVLKIEKLEGYIRKAQVRLASQEKALARLYERSVGDTAEVEHSLRRLKLTSAKKSLR